MDRTGPAATPAAKVVAPAVASTALPRPALEELLSAGLERRLISVVAGAGFGKSTLAASWASGVNSAWYTLGPEDADLGSLVRGVVHALRLRLPGLPAELAAVAESPQGPDADADELLRARAAAGALCDALSGRLRRDLVLVLDDAHELGAAGAARFVEALCRQAPSRLHLALVSREEPPFPLERLRGQGQVLDVTARDLAFTADEVAQLLASELDESASGLAALVHDVADGWPAAVRLAIEALRGVPGPERVDALERVARTEGPLFAYLAAEVFEREPPAVRELIRTAALFPRFTPELCEALGIVDARATLDALAGRGLFLEPARRDAPWLSLSTLVRDFALAHHPLAPDEVRALYTRAAVWFESNGRLEEALRSIVASGDRESLAAHLAEHGQALLRAAAVESVAAAAALLPPGLRDARIEELEGAARQIRGDWEGALACFDRIAPPVGTLGPGLAWRIGLIHHLRGRLDDALAVYERGELGTGDDRDEALLLAWKASAYWLLGDLEACRECAESAFAVATSAGDRQALAAAHTVLAMVAALDGDRGANDAHYLRGLELAEAAGDLLQMIRIHVNRASHHLEEGAYAETLAELEPGMALAELAGFATFRAHGLTNRGEARFHLGELEEAVADLEAAKAIYQRMGSRLLAYPLERLATIYRERGDLALARGAYEEAVVLAEQAGDLQCLVPALAGLARVLADEEPELAEELARRAVEYGPGMAYVTGLLAVGRVALARREPERAAEAGFEAAAAARTRRDRAGLAEALEVQALAAGPPEPRLEEALAIWREIGDPLGEARTELELARVLDGPRALELAERAERRLRQLGARGQAAQASSLRAALERRTRAPVAFQTLGAFRTLRDGEPVALGEWQSKKARDLLKILIARRGRPVPRHFLMEALWPDEDPERLANRLSVALATIRGVLDPEKQFGPEHFVAADRSAVRLELDHVEVDVEAFLADASAGLALPREAARECLARAEAAYAGDFLEEDAYEDWALPLREEAQALYVQVARELAEDASARGEHDAATRYLLRTLERDPYDEQAHLGLVRTLLASGRHGAARRFFRAYCARMDEIGVEAAPFPSAVTVAREGG